MTNFIFRPLNAFDDSEVDQVLTIDNHIPAAWGTPLIDIEGRVASTKKKLQEKGIDKIFFELVFSEEKSAVPMLCGFHWVELDKDHNDQLIGRIKTLWVHPDFRQKGLGQKLKLKAESWAKERGALRISTQVHSQNKTMLRLNAALGFTPTFITFEKEL